MINWTVNKTRKEILYNPARFKVIVAGRRWGKTVLSLMYLLKDSFQPNERRWFITPTYRQGKMIVFPVLRQMFAGFDNAKLNESEMSVVFSNGAELAVKGADNEHNLRGVELTKAVMDEMAYIKPHVWEEIIMPMLATTQGECLFIGTPSGYDIMYELYNKGQSDTNWKSWQFKTIDGGFVPKEEIDLARRTMDDIVFRQEFEGSFETTGNRAAYNFSRDDHCIKANELSSNLWWGVDFNVDYMTAVLACQFTDGTIHFFDEIRLKNSNTEELAIAMKKIAPNIECYPDPAGKARSTVSRRSDHQILRDHSFLIRAKKSHPSHIDRLNALNRKLKDAEGRIGMTVDPSCTYLIKDLEQCQRDKKGGLAKDNIELTHALDACSYAISYKFPIRRMIGKMMEW
ncbi:MAG: putative terminase large subunit [Prokaryotic dsDNA virus sp.]|nr:MAG: putative terminase large subunit [Prokaryotic dsDNA virus sp.]|tara:strand:+ start:20704 stop:21906 length:1203 start_codon:yes stop_codon:yes gene_type:complete